MDIGNRQSARFDIGQSEARFRALFDSMDEAYCVIEVLFDDHGRANDYLFLQVNPAFVRLTGWPDAVGTRMRQIAPNHEEHWFEIYGKVALTGESIRVVQRADILDARWFDLFAFRLGGAESRKVAVLFTDVTESRRARAALAVARMELSELIDLAPAFMTVWRGPDLVVEVANDAYRRLVGERELIGRPIREAFPEVEDQGFFEIVENVHATGQPWVGHDVAVKLRMRPGEPPEERYLDLVYQALRGADGAITGVFAHGVDITERRRAEEGLRAAAAQAEQQARVFDTTLSAMTDPVCTFGRDARLVYANRAMLALLGLRLEDVVGRAIAQLGLPDELTARWARQVRGILATGEGVVDEAEYTGADGTAGHFEYIFRAVFDAQGRAEQVAGSMRDITARKRAEDELKDADRQRTQFLAMLAHELRNPLAPIRTAVHFLRRTDGKHEAAQSMFQMMERQVAHMARLIDDLLDVSRISRGKIELRRERVDLAVAVQQAVEATQPLAANMAQDLTVTLPARPIHLLADPTRLSQVIGNLLNNACKFSPRGGSVRLVVERAQGDALVRVVDSGIGIPAQQLQRIFEMFTQLDTSLDRAQGGLGIGLTLVRDLVEMHGGRVDAFSAGAGQGSEFVVRLPLLPDAPAVAGEEAAPVRAPGTQRILVVDDNVESAQLLAMLLRLDGHDVTVATDGLQAVDAVAGARFDTVLLDIGLPRLDGYGVARSIRARGDADVALIAMTGWGQDDDRRRTREAGFDAHLTKPIDHRQLALLLAARGERGG